jgi:hypothetical protein
MPSIHLHIKMKTPLQLDNASHHHPQCPYPHTFSLQQAYNPAFITREIFLLELEHSRGHGYQSRLPGVIFPGMDFWSLLMLFASDCTKGTKETQHAALLSLERKERGGIEALGISPYISVFVTLVYFQSSRSCTNTNLYAGPAMNLGPLDRTFTFFNYVSLSPLTACAWNRASTKRLFRDLQEHWQQDWDVLQKAASVSSAS